MILFSAGSLNWMMQILLTPGLFSILRLWSEMNHEEIWWSWSVVHFSFYFSSWVISLSPDKIVHIFCEFLPENSILVTLSLFWWKTFLKGLNGVFGKYFKITKINNVWMNVQCYCWNNGPSYRAPASWSVLYVWGSVQN